MALAGKAAVIIGGVGGIGMATAHHYLKNGVVVSFNQTKIYFACLIEMYTFTMLDHIYQMIDELSIFSRIWRYWMCAKTTKRLRSLKISSKKRT